jgi:DNA repair photolyase
LVCR